MAKKNKEVYQVYDAKDFEEVLELIKSEIDLSISAKDINDAILKGDLSASKKAKFQSAAEAGWAVKSMWDSIDKKEAGKIDKEIDKLWNSYKKQYAAKAETLNSSYGANISPNVPESRKQEFVTFLLANQIENFQPRDNLAAYMGGDIDTDAGKRVQLKGPNSEFTLNFKMEHIGKEFSKWTLPRSEAIAAADSKLWQNIARLHINAEKITKSVESSKNRQTAKNKADLMAQYKTISAADWYIFEFPNPPILRSKSSGMTREGTSGISVSVRAEKIVDFVRAYPDFFQIDSRKGRFIKYSLRFMLKKRTTIPAIFAVGVTEPKFAIHYQDSAFFYYTRGLVGASYEPPSEYTDSDVRTYNSNINSNRSDFMLIHNNFFGGLDY